ncbi:P-loop containing nucleoside triphosphate hydrolase protein [Tuber magnatum]|uniref:RNA helicase n=1 Tax=Tuber magnatum TaxID=42249 RepID=A0A317SCW7_9PEZI|nr:P-loop containing nucleoside triphosphate hydrolase protein [Tuber magnatum]
MKIRELRKPKRPPPPPPPPPSQPMLPPIIKSKKRTRQPADPKPVVKRAKINNGYKVTLDELGWKEVSMPDRLDDVEGFYGLEEIDGVDVEIDGSGRVEYKGARKGKKDKKEEKEAVDDEDEWGGIKNDCDSGKEVISKKARKGEKKAAPAKSEKQQKKAKRLKSEDSKLGGSFALLSDEDEDVFLPAWNSLNLSLPTLRALSKLNFNTPTPIQSSAIPEIVAGHDLIGKASTGSGKTLAFGIPILEYYLSRPHKISKTKEGAEEKLPVALILSPTRELAHQLHAHLKALTAYAPDMSIVSVTGGLSLQKQIRKLTERGGVDVIVATPGRLWEVVSEGQGWIAKLRRGLRFLVVDEADRLLQEGHFKEVEEVMNLLGRRGAESEGEGEGEGDIDEDEYFRRRNSVKGSSQEQVTGRQTLVFSATFHKGLQQKLTGKGGKKGLGGDLMGEKESMEYLLKKLKFKDRAPKFIDANPVGQLAERLREGIIECGATEKDLYLYYLLLRYPSKTLIFTNSITSVNRLSPLLTNLNLPAHPLHSKMIQKARLRSLERFSSPTYPNSILIATDVAARGLDIQNVDLIIHYHLPRTADTYVHRSGRTARGVDARGVSILLCSPEEVIGVRRLVAKVHGPESLSTARYAMRSFDADRKLVTRLKRRVELAKKVADCQIEKTKKGHEDEWLKAAAEDLGVEYNSDGFTGNGGSGGAAAGKRGKGRRKRRETAATATKAEVASWRAELAGLLKEKVNAGFSTKYLTAGNVNLAQALVNDEGMSASFLGLEERRVVDEVGM